jgi:glycosyltransferase EpsF
MILPLVRLTISSNATKLLACSYKAGDVLYGKMNFEFFPNAIDLMPYRSLGECDKTKVMSELNLDDDTILIGNVARFEEVKNQIFLVPFAKRLKLLDIKFCIVLVGDGTLYKKIEDMFYEEGLKDFVRFLGVRNDIPRLMNAFDLFMLTSLSEGFCMVTSEAQAAGTPCLVSSGVPNQIDLGLNIVSFLNLNEKIEVWSNEALKMCRKARPDKEKIINTFKEKNMDINCSCERISDIYGV